MAYEPHDSLLWITNEEGSLAIQKLHVIYAPYVILVLKVLDASDLPNVELQSVMDANVGIGDFHQANDVLQVGVMGVAISVAGADAIDDGLIHDELQQEAANFGVAVHDAKSLDDGLLLHVDAVLQRFLAHLSQHQQEHQKIMAQIDPIKPR